MDNEFGALIFVLIPQTKDQKPNGENKPQFSSRTHFSYNLLNESEDLNSSWI